MPDQHREVIDRFTGPYAFLSNFHPCRVTFYGMTFTACFVHNTHAGCRWLPAVCWRKIS